MVNLETRWFVTTLERLSTLAVFLGKRGMGPGLFHHFDPANVTAFDPATGQSLGGNWVGHLPGHTNGTSVVAVTLDHDLLAPGVIVAAWSDLETAPDAVVFDMRAGMSTPGNSWARFGSFGARLTGRQLDYGRFQDPPRSIRHHIRETCRTLMFLNLLGRHSHALDLDERFSRIPQHGRTAMGDHLVEQGLPSALVPNPGTTLRDGYRAILADAWTEDRWGFLDGRFHLGHPTANLEQL